MAQTMKSEYTGVTAKQSAEWLADSYRKFYKNVEVEASFKGPSKETEQ